MTCVIFAIFIYMFIYGHTTQAHTHTHTLTHKMVHYVLWFVRWVFFSSLFLLSNSRYRRVPSVPSVMGVVCTAFFNWIFVHHNLENYFFPSLINCCLLYNWNCDSVTRRKRDPFGSFCTPSPTFLIPCLSLDVSYSFCIQVNNSEPLPPPHSNEIWLSRSVSVRKARDL